MSDSLRDHFARHGQVVAFTEGQGMSDDQVDDPADEQVDDAALPDVTVEEAELVGLRAELADLREELAEMRHKAHKWQVRIQDLETELHRRLTEVWVIAWSNALEVPDEAREAWPDGAWDLALSKIKERLDPVVDTGFLTRPIGYVEPTAVEVQVQSELNASLDDLAADSIAGPDHIVVQWATSKFGVFRRVPQEWGDSNRMADFYPDEVAECTSKDAALEVARALEAAKS